MPYITKRAARVNHSTHAESCGDRSHQATSALGTTVATGLPVNPRAASEVALRLVGRDGVAREVGLLKRLQRLVALVEGVPAVGEAVIQQQASACERVNPPPPTTPTTRLLLPLLLVLLLLPLLLLPLTIKGGRRMRINPRILRVDPRRRGITLIELGRRVHHGIHAAHELPRRRT